jgi:C4-dicarboxylate transporter DctM subunit
MIVVYLRALMAGRESAPAATRATRINAAVQAIIPLMMPVLLIGGIISGIGTPTEISSFAVVYGLLLGVALYGQIGLRSLWSLLTEASLMSGMIFFNL